MTLVSIMAQAQALSLRECIEIGLERNLTVRQKAEDIRLADVTRSENRNKLLPVIQAFGSFTDNVHRGTTVTDGTGIGQLLGIDMQYSKTQGLQYVTQGGVQAQMPLYDQTLYIGLKIADRMKEISENSLSLAREQLIVEIARLYYLAQTTHEQTRLLESDIRALEALDSITQALRSEGMVLAVDVKRIGLTLSTMHVQRDNAQSSYEQQLNLMRYVLDMSPDTPLALQPVADYREKTLDYRLQNWSGLSSTLPELHGLDLQLALNELQRRQVRYGYLPTLSLVGNLSWANFTDKFHHYFHDHPSNHWYNTTYFALQLAVPIYDRGVKRNAIRRLDIQADKLRLSQESTQKQLQTQYLNGLCDYQNQQRTLHQQQANYQLAREVYDVTADQYREGVTSMTTLLQDDMNRSTARTAYIGALYNYLVSELMLLRLTGNLDVLTK